MIIINKYIKVLKYYINKMYSFLLLFTLICSVSSWKTEKTYCNIVVNDLLQNTYEPVLSEEWNYHSLQSQMRKNVLCGIIYLHDNKMIIVDNESPRNITLHNMHLVKTTPELANSVIQKLQDNYIDFYIEDYYPRSSWLIWSVSLFFKLLYYFSMYFMFRSSLRLLWIMRTLHLQEIYNNNDKKEDKTMFCDVAGCDEAKFELQEVVDFLKHPEKFKEAGAKIPAGVLLEGPPGTGKTMLAKATSNEAGVSFIYANGSQFIEMYVGVGASRVRKLFEQAKANKPCIVFIDEIDAVGRSRTSGFESNSEQDQTINQLLTNMDGFDKNDGIIVMGATNRADMLDSALTRKGRFDRKITVGLPDKEGRQEILDVHLDDKNVEKNLKLDSIYELTSGFSGADLANLVNEACILSVRYKLPNITEKCFVDAFEKTTIGLPKQTDRRPKENIKMVAYHEAGHTIGALFFKDIFDVRRVTINANNSGAGGYTLFTPKEEVVQFPTKRYMLANIIVCLGGRAAEMFLYKTQQKDQSVDELVFPDIDDLNVTIGASNDLKQAHSLARNYITTYGLGNNVGLYDSDDYRQFHTKMSDYTKKRIDKEIESIIDKSLESMLRILEVNKDQLDSISELLINYKTIDETMLHEKIQITYEFD
jgi:cell division protease FtsH